MTEEEIDAAEKALGNDYGRTFSTEHGRRVLRHLAAHFDLNGPCFRTGEDSHTAAQRDGQKQVLTHILKYSNKNATGN